MPPETVIRVLMVDDHPAIRQGVAVLLAPQGITVCAEAEGVADALAQLDTCRPDAVLVDLSLDGVDGATLIADLTQRGVRTLVYSMHQNVQRVNAAFAAGALGYVTKREPHEVLAEAIRAVAAGQRFVSPRVGLALLEANSVPAPPAEDARPLSPKEAKVYAMLGQGMNAAEIATALGITERTAETYYARLQHKLRVEGMHELRRLAIDTYARSGGKPA